MEFIGKIVAIGETREGSNDKGSWKVRVFVLEDISSEYPQSVLLTAKGTLVERLQDLLDMQQPGQKEFIPGIYKARISCKVRKTVKQDGSAFLMNDLFCNHLERL